jgi:hypothetical protein
MDFRIPCMILLVLEIAQHHAQLVIPLPILQNVRIPLNLQILLNLRTLPTLTLSIGTGHQGKEVGRRLLPLNQLRFG